MGKINGQGLDKLFILRNQLFLVAILLLSLFFSSESFSSFRKPSRFFNSIYRPTFKMTSFACASSHIKVLEIPLPFSMDSNDSYLAWQTQEQHRLLNQMLIAQSISAGT